MKRPEVSVIIPAYNAGNYIEKCLLSLQNQTFKDFEIIVIDDASQDQTAQIAQKYARVIRNRMNFGEGFSRKAGAEAAYGKILAQTDSDVILPSTWLDNIVTNIKQRGMKAVAGGYCASIGHSFIERFSHLELLFRRKNLDGYVNTVAFNNFACYRDIFLKYSESTGNYRCEDLRFSFKISKHHQIYWDKDNGVFHYFRPSVIAYLRQQYYFGRDTIWSYYCYPEMFFKLTHQGRLIYLETILMFLAILGIFLSHVTVPISLALILLFNNGFLRFLKKEGLSITLSVPLILIRDVVCVVSVFSGMGQVVIDIARGCKNRRKAV